MIDIYIFRHAHSTINKDSEIVYGRSLEAKLTELGEGQALACGRRLRSENVTFDEIYSSPAVRAFQTAQGIAQATGYSRAITVVDELIEQSLGDWEGRPRSEVYCPENIAELNRNRWQFQIPGGESLQTVADRVYGWVQDKIIGKESDKRMALVTHAIAAKTLLKMIMGFDSNMIYHMKMGHMGISQVLYENGVWKVVRVNDTAHLFAGINGSHIS